MSQITEAQLEQLDNLLSSFTNLNSCADTKTNGDDAEMAAVVKLSAEAVQSSLPLASITHIQALYPQAG